MRLFRKKKSKNLKEMKRAVGFPELDGPGYRDVLSALERALQPEWYLEIGSRRGTSLRDRSCNFIAIDPVFRLDGSVFNTSSAQLFFQEESDRFFERDFLRAARIAPKLAFLDGLHIIEYLFRDLRNAEANMSPDGAIAVHDVVPFNSEMTVRDTTADTYLNAWTGDVWKIIPILQKWRPDLVLKVVGAPRTGLLVVTNLDPENKTLFEREREILVEFQELTLDEFGVDKFFRSFDLIAPDAFISSL